MMPIFWLFAFLGALIGSIFWWIIASGWWPVFLVAFAAYIALRLWYVYRRQA